MSITNGYCTLAELNARLSSFEEGDEPERDDHLETIIEATSRAIDMEVGHRFYAVSETRYYTPKDAHKVYVDDLLTVTNLYTDPDGDLDYDYTWTTSDYLLMPANAATDGYPYHYIQRHPNGNYWFPTWRNNRSGLVNGVKLEGSFGFCALANVPAYVKYACILTAQQAWMRHSAIFGTVGPEGLMFQIRQVMWRDPTIMGYLNSIREIL